MKIERILIATDGADASGQVVRFGFNMAADLNARVQLVGITTPSSIMGNPDAGIFPDDAAETAETKLSKHLLQMKTQYGANVETVLLSKEAGVEQGIIDSAIKWNADLIIVGTHGHSGINSLFHKSIAESVIHHSPVPVCVVPIANSFA